MGFSCCSASCTQAASPPALGSELLVLDAAVHAHRLGGKEGGCKPQQQECCCGNAVVAMHTRLCRGLHLQGPTLQAVTLGAPCLHCPVWLPLAQSSH